MSKKDHLKHKVNSTVKHVGELFESLTPSFKASSGVQRCLSEMVHATMRDNTCPKITAQHLAALTTAIKDTGRYEHGKLDRIAKGTAAYIQSNYGSNAAIRMAT